MRHESGRKFWRGLVRTVSFKPDGRGGAAERASRPGFEPLEPRVLLNGDPVILGDYDGNGFVSQSDLDLVLLNWGDDPVGNGTAVPSGWVNDLPVDTISQNELDGVLLNWGSTVAPNAEDGRRIGLTSGQTVEDDLGTINDVDTFTITAQAGETLFLNFDDTVANTGFDPGVFIFSPDGILLESEDNQTNGISFTSLALAQTGTYTVVIRDMGNTASGGYALTAVVIDETVDADNVALASGATTPGDLALADIDTFTIGGSAGETLFLNFDDTVGGTGFDPGIFIFNPDGTLLDSADDQSNGTSFTNLSLTQTGTYTVLIRDLSGESTGGYALTAVVVDETVDADNVALASGATTPGDLALADIDTFTIAGSAGDTLSLNFTEAIVSTGFDPGIFIFNPDGTLLDSADNQSNGFLFTDLALTQTGSYTVLIRDLSGESTGDYDLTVTVNPPALNAATTPTEDAEAIIEESLIGSPLRRY